MIYGFLKSLPLFELSIKYSVQRQEMIACVIVSFLDKKGPFVHCLFTAPQILALVCLKSFESNFSDQNL